MTASLFRTASLRYRRLWIPLIFLLTVTTITSHLALGWGIPELPLAPVVAVTIVALTDVGHALYVYEVRESMHRSIHLSEDPELSDLRARAEAQRTTLNRTPRD